MTRTQPNPAASHAPTTETPAPVADVSGIALHEHAVIHLGPDWPTVRALARIAGVVVAGAVLGEHVAGPEGVVVGALTTFITYVATATAVTAIRTRTRTANWSQR